MTKTSQPDEEVQQLMHSVGARVRRARERRGVSRRVLSDLSGVSPRYLAQLETGEGNISIGLLHRVATALDHKIDWFVGIDDPWTSDIVQLTDRYCAADEATKTRVMRLLAPVSDSVARAQRICLVGLRGAGKTTLGHAVSTATGVPFVELNAQIAAQAGMPVSEIMALYGEEGYRKLEADGINRICAAQDRLILAVGGGIVSEPATYAGLLRRFHTIWLKASPQEHMDRVRAQGDERPMAGNPEAMAQLRSILTSREVLYAQAEAELDTTGKPMETSLSELLTLIQDYQFLT